MKLCVFLLLAICFVGADENTKSEELFTLQSPQNWRAEHIPFPLSFAPDIEYKGFEELRFAPGMFKPEAKDYFSYVFFFWIEDETEIDSTQISTILLKYYKGLCSAVSEQRQLKLDIEKIKVHTEEKITDEENHKRNFFAQVDWYDPFVTGKELTLYMEIDVFKTSSGKTILFASVSPLEPSKEESKVIWEQMRQIQATFECK